MRLGVTLDATLSFNDHIMNVVRACNLQLWAFYHIRHRSVNQDIARTMTCSIASSRIDYCNTLLYDATSKALNCLQCIKNNLNRMVFRYHHLQTSQLLPQISWSTVGASRTTRCFRPESGRKWHCRASETTNSDHQPTCHCYWDSIHRYAVYTRRLKTCWLFRDQVPKLQCADSLQLQLILKQPSGYSPS